MGSTYGIQEIIVAVRIGLADNRPSGPGETRRAHRAAISREIMMRVYEEQLVGPAPRFPREIEDGINRYLRLRRRPAHEHLLDLGTEGGS